MEFQFLMVQYLIIIWSFFPTVDASLVGLGQWVMGVLKRGTSLLAVSWAANSDSSWKADNNKNMFSVYYVELNLQMRLQIRKGSANLSVCWCCAPGRWCFFQSDLVFWTSWVTVCDLAGLIYTHKYRRSPNSTSNEDERRANECTPVSEHVTAVDSFLLRP